MAKPFYLFFVWLLCLSSSAIAQEEPKRDPDAPQQPVRLELESVTESHWTEVIILSDSSVLFCLNKSPYRFSREPYTFTKYNHRLAPVWNNSIEIPVGAEYLQSYTQGPDIYFLFIGPKPTEFHILRMLVSNGQASLSNHQKTSQVEFTGFKAFGNQVFLTGIENNNLMATHLDLATKESKILPAIYDQQTALADFRIDTLTGHAEFVLSESNRQRSRLTVKRISSAGELVNTHFVLPQYERNLLTAQLAPGDTTDKLLAGTFIDREFKFAQGIFTHTLGGDIRYYDFKTFTRFFDYLSKRRQRTIRQKIQRYEAMNKFLKLRYKLLLHDIYPYKGGHLLVAEAYSPQYNAESNLHSIRGMTMGAFEGYRFSHALLCAFDRQGNLLWENSFPLKNVVNRVLTPNLQVGFAGDRIFLTYADKENIHYKVVTGGKETPNDLKVEVLTYSEEEKALTPTYVGVLHWHSSSFLAYGFHRVRPSTGPSRSVFYLNKVTF
ncbi:hypothetical protein BH24BAC1_BH24BAC1_06160 [soil metagenome]